MKKITSKYSRYKNCEILVIFLMMYLFYKYQDFFIKNISFLSIGTIALIILFLTIKILTNHGKRKYYLTKNINFIDKMQGVEFEKLLKAHFEKQGFKVELTSGSHDYGVDLICMKKKNANEDIHREINANKFVIQAKRYKGKVGIKSVQEIIGGMRYNDCHIGLVISNSYFTKNAWELAKKSNVILWDRNKIIDIFGIK